jgi:hypothetical protein
MKSYISGAMIALACLVSGTAHAVTIDSLHMTSEKGITVQELRDLNAAGHSAGLHQGDYPDSLHAADYPNSLHAADYPDSLHAGDYPDSYHAADYPNSRVELGKPDGTERLPQPVVDL